MGNVVQLHNRRDPKEPLEYSIEVKVHDDTTIDATVYTPKHRSKDDLVADLQAIIEILKG